MVVNQLYLMAPYKDRPTNIYRLMGITLTLWAGYFLKLKCAKNLFQRLKTNKCGLSLYIGRPLPIIGSRETHSHLGQSWLYFSVRPAGNRFCGLQGKKPPILALDSNSLQQAAPPCLRISLHVRIKPLKQDSCDLQDESPEKKSMV
jgi:hypothetical protein